jgi:hypothetical protein
MNFNDLKSKAKNLIADRGGTEALKEDAEEVKDIAQGEGTVTEKGKDAVEALKDPGAPGA